MTKNQIFSVLAAFVLSTASVSILFTYDQDAPVPQAVPTGASDGNNMDVARPSLPADALGHSSIAAATTSKKLLAIARNETRSHFSLIATHFSNLPHGYRRDANGDHGCSKVRRLLERCYRPTNPWPLDLGNVHSALLSA